MFSSLAMEILLLSLLSLCYVFFYLFKLVLKRRDQSCYMLAYECYKPPEDTKLDIDLYEKICLRNRSLGLEEFKFLLKCMTKSGIGGNTYAPRNIIEGRESDATVEDSLKEMDEIMFDTLDNLFTSTKFSPSKIDILVVSVSSFVPVPSLTSRIINRYKLRDNIKAFNLGGMGCCGSGIAIDLVQRLLKTYKNSYAVVVCSECLSQSWYCGKVKSMMLPYCLFRSGGCSMLFTNMSSQKRIAMMRLKHVERTHLGAKDEAYGCAMLVEDGQGYPGFGLARSLPKAAAEALEMNLKILVPKILPLWKILWYFSVFLCKCIMKKALMSNMLGSLELKSGIEHFCVHPGGRAVVEEVAKWLRLNDYDIEPSKMTIHRWGNTSASGVWYVFSYMEAKKRLKKGDRILMIGLGSGFKCCNCVWEVMRDLESANVWKDCIDSYSPTTLTSIFEERYGWINDPANQAVIEAQLLAKIHPSN
ncbi:3-ketoacyl-CoA synthase 19-like [Abrus precatorius]|uniref:3-ketoacyl-CoA synthase n=1 Tax=Abrus precatorius TaxID=3816 RepID=A0A8B8KI96_ABRPR|nr:3-ketoacyl-CoA synthase 19-like [Abrus precatorius]